MVQLEGTTLTFFCDGAGYNNRTVVFGRPRVCGEHKTKKIKIKTITKQRTKRKKYLVCVSDRMLLVCICTLRVICLSSLTTDYQASLALLRTSLIFILTKI